MDIYDELHSGFIQLKFSIFERTFDLLAKLTIVLLRLCLFVAMPY